MQEQKISIQMKSQVLNLLFLVVFLGLGFYLGKNSEAASEENTETTRTETSPKEESKVAITEEAPQSTDELVYERPRRNNKGLTKDERATISLFENAAPSVVFITTSKLQRISFSRDLAEIPSGTGTGFMWDKNGHIITNYHVVQGGNRYQVTLNDQSTWDAELIGYAAEKDLAVLKVDTPKDQLTPIPVGDSEILQVGQATYAIGNPFGLDQSLTTGIISALGREIESVGRVKIRDVIQTDAAINPGNSGGPLLNSSGELIGVNTAIYSPSGAYAGIGFSIPVDAVSWVVPDLIKYGRINRATIGISPLRLRQPIEGVVVGSVGAGTGAERAGLQPTVRDRYGRVRLGDIIVGVDEKSVASYSDLILALEEYQSGDVVMLKLIRDRSEVELEVELGSSVE